MQTMSTNNSLPTHAKPLNFSFVHEYKVDFAINVTKDSSLYVHVSDMEASKREERFLFDADPSATKEHGSRNSIEIILENSRNGTTSLNA